METKKMTKKEAYTYMLDLIKGDEREAELTEVLTKDIATLEKKRTSLTKNQVANLELTDKVYEVMATLEDKVTIAELYKLEAIQAIEGITSTQKLQALIKKLVDTGRVVRTEDKRKAYFRVATED